MKKMVILVLMLCLLSGCTTRKCIKSHQEISRCTRYTRVKIGNTHTKIPHRYSCIKTICDEYEEVD